MLRHDLSSTVGLNKTINGQSKFSIKDQQPVTYLYMNNKGEQLNHKIMDILSSEIQINEQDPTATRKSSQKAIFNSSRHRFKTDDINDSEQNRMINTIQMVGALIDNKQFARDISMHDLINRK